MEKEFEALEYFADTYKEFLKGKDMYCQITLTRTQAIEVIKEFEALKTIKIKCHPNSNPSPLVDEALEIIEQALLKAQEQEKVLEIIKKKCLHTNNLNEVATCLNYNYYKERMSKKYDTKVVKTDWNDKVLLDYLKLLTEEEFDLLKRRINNDK